MKTLLLLVLITSLHVPNSSGCIYRLPSLHIIIKDRDTKLPLSNVTVLLIDKYGNLHAMTDSNGSAKFYVTGDEYKIRIKGINYLVLDYTVNVDTDEDVQLVVKLSTKARHKVLEYKTKRWFAYSPDIIQPVVFPVAEPWAFACVQTHKSRNNWTGNTKELNKTIAFPNPASDQINIESLFDGNKTLVVYDLGGKEIYRNSIVFHCTINTANFENGIYILRVIDAVNDDVSVLKFVVSK